MLYNNTGYTLLLQGLLLMGMTVLVSCEEPVDLNIDLPKSKLVISSSFLSGQPVYLQVSATWPRGEQQSLPIRDADVRLYQGNELAEVLTYHNSKELADGGIYRTDKFVPEVGQEYTILVSAEGYDPVSAVSSIPKSVEINSLEVTNLSRMDLEDEQIYDYRLTIDYADPPNEVNYYDLRISQLVIPFNVNTHGDTLFSAPYVKAVNSPTRPPGLNDKAISLLIQDKGGQDQVQIPLQSRINPRREILGRIIAELRTVSPEYYFFRRSLVQPGDLVSDGLEEPVILYNNVDRGLGVFAGYSSVNQDISIPSH